MMENRKTIIIVLFFLLTTLFSVNLFAQHFCARFDGIDDYIVAPDIDLTNQMTIEFWVKPSAFLNNGSRIITKVFATTPYGTYGVYEVFIASNGNFPVFNLVDTQDDNHQVYLHSDQGGALNINTWIHIAVTYDGSYMRIFYNGELQSYNQVSMTIKETNYPLFFGRWNPSGNEFSGYIDELRIWNVAKTQSEILLNKNKILTGNESGLLAYYRFENDCLDETSHNNDGTGYGITYALSQVPLAMLPIVNTQPVTSIKSTTATLNGTVNANSQSTTVIFEYGKTTSYGTTVIANPNTVTGNSETPVKYNLTGLDPNTTYHCRVVATNNSGTSEGEDVSFTTFDLTPIVTTDPASNIDEHSATLNGTVNANGQSSTVIFEYGKTILYGSTVIANPNTVTGNTDTPVKYEVTGLDPNTTYHYRVVSTNNSGTSEGSDQTFVTLLSVVDKPTAITIDAENITTNSVTLKGFVNPKGLSTTVIFEYGETTSYGNEITAAQSPITGSSVVSVSANLTELTENTTYHFRVKATNSQGITNGADESFTTLQSGGAPIATTSLPEEITANSAILKGEINANGLSTTVSFEYGESISYGSTVIAVPNTVTGTTNTPVVYHLSGLQKNTTYHYRVLATNSQGTSNGMDQSFTTLESGSAPSAITESPESITTNSVILNGKVNPNELNTTVIFEYGETTSYGNQITASQSPVAGTINLEVNALLSGLSDNTTYHFRVKATNSAGLSYGEDRIFKTQINYPETYTLEQNITFPIHEKGSDYQPEDYRLIGLPGNPDLPVYSLFTGNHNEDWQVYWDNGKPTDYFVAYENSQIFNFKRGRGFWIISIGEINIDVNVNSAQLNNSFQVELPLHSGWNIITNPVNEPISWNLIKDVNEISEPIWNYNGSFTKANNFVPFKGYYFYNSENSSVLQIPYKAQALGKMTVNFDGPKDWRLNISVCEKEKFSETVSLGVSSYAELGVGRFDYHKPRSLGKKPDIIFERMEWDENFPNFASDIRPYYKDVESWDFKILSPKKEQVILKIFGINDVPIEFDIILIEKSNLNYMDIRKNNEIILRPDSESSNFNLVVGKPGKIQEHIENLLPESFSLEANYPNPFNPSTTIPLNIPVDSKIDLSVYNMLGQKIYTLHNGHISSGKYFFIWEGCDVYRKPVPTGVYIVKCTSETGYLGLRKILFIK